MKRTLPTLLLTVVAILAFSQESEFGLNPSREYAITPEDYDLKYEIIKIMTEDSLELHGWMFFPDEKSYKIMILSDDGNGNMADLIEHVGVFLSLGFNVLTYDYRGYGKSQDFDVNKLFYISHYFERDLNAAIDFVENEYTYITKLHLYGQGIGAGLSISVGANKDAGIIIADSPYTSFEEIRKRILEIKGDDLKMPLVYDKNKLEPKYALELKYLALRGLLIIVGENDEIYTEKYLKDLSKMKKDKTELWEVDGANRKNTYTIDKEAYYNAVKEFLEEHPFN